MPALLRVTERGLYCEAGDFFVDPWGAVDRAIITHAHGDHVAWGCRHYLTSEPGLGVRRRRIDPGASISSAEYRARLVLNEVRVSLHPAGQPFEPVRCHTFITESTFGLPVYRWPAQSEVFAAVNGWWRANAEQGVASLLFGYALGKAQRLLAGLDPSVGPILTHGAVETMTTAYRDAGVSLPPTTYAAGARRAPEWGRALVLAPPSADGSPWTRQFGTASTAFASGWMRVRGARRRRSLDRGFVLSDHVEWPGLLGAIEATGAKHVWATHGYTGVVVRWLRELGLDARSVETRFEGERDDDT